jgi:hypothetical protein
MKNNLWIFGDSMSASFKDTVTSFWFKPYIQKLQIDKFLFWQEIVAEKFNLGIVDNAVGGFDNYSILETFCKKSIDIRKGDYVILNWSDVTRFRIPVNEDRFTRVLPGNIDPELLKNNLFTETELKKLTVSRDHKLFQEEVDNWSLLINEFCRLKEAKVLFWGICDYRPYFFINLYDLRKEAGGYRILDQFPELNDHHFSLNGHKVFAEKVIKELENSKNTLAK